ncbi:efflux RND transporter periplasmic adaptor subunit [Rhizobium sp. S153]|uniref:Efflux RND transporter periplasmic adaptor subunit n=1 Tax=Ciceribacter sichuanensis TaxID=2949647 RepID=A0ABT0VBM1_9HYPH|nr:efflux RND transporter periplasmic adaptor subunit [Ciceribacter sp. S153]MCM2402611.1 efflux RND transporter periplasmic adaptor subunit [Ciceribacter sp. S153]
MTSLRDFLFSKFPALALVFALALGVSGCSEEKQAETKEPIRPVKIARISATSHEQAAIYSGTVKARVETSLGFRVAGKIIERRVNVGDRVRPGDILARIDPTDYQLSVRTAEASLAAAETAVATADLANKRAQQLFDKSVTAKSQVEQARLNYDQAVSTRDAAISTLDQARNQVSYTELKSDREGIVTAISSDTGAVVAAGTPVATVALDNEKEVQIAVPEGDIADFRPGKTVKASFWSDHTLAIDGRVREVSGSADTQSRTFAVRISLPDNAQVLLGMTATIEAARENTRGYLAVPLSALAERNGQKIVWVVDPQTSTVSAREIRVAEFTADGVNVSSGVKPDDLVVAAGTQFMRDDLKVKLPQEESALLRPSDTVR